MPDVNMIWNDVLDILREEISEVSFKTWFEPITPISIDDKTLTLAVKFDVNKHMVITKYHSLIQNTLQVVTGESYAIEVVSDDVEMPAPPPPPPEIDFGFNPKFTFDSFVVGKDNSYANANALFVAENPGQKDHNPLFLYGGSGLGKTHLLHAIANRAISLNPRMRIMCTTTEKFTNDYVTSLLSQRTSKTSVQEFKDRYRNIDMFLVDDIQFVGGRDGFQEEFFHTFNEIYDANKQIVLTCDRLPQEIPKLTERLRQRFSGGLLADVQPPDFEVRCAILKDKFQKEYLNVDNSIIELIANSIHSNVRDLEGAVKRMLAYTTIERTSEITIELAERVLGDVFTMTRRKLTPPLVIAAVEKYFDLPRGSLISKNRSQHYALPRQVAMYITRHMTETNLNDIGSEFGGRSHSTVIHSINKTEAEMAGNPILKAAVEIITNDLIRN